MSKQIIRLTSRFFAFALCVAAIFCLHSVGYSADPAPSQSILASKGLCENPKGMMRAKFLAEIADAEKEWIANYEAIETKEDVEAYQKARREAFKNALGPMWERTPLNAKVTGQGVKEKYRYENIVFESIPGVYVTGTLFLPLEELFKGPYPAMTVVCGHSSNGKAYELYQSVGVLAAVNGLAGFVVDPIDQGERHQYLKEDEKPVYETVAAHNLVQAGSILVGRNTATFEVWDIMRAIDYLQSRPDIVADKIGVCGTSGGGTQTAYIMSLDDRVALAAPSCYICSFFNNLTKKLGPQDGEQNIFGQLAFGMDHADYLFLRAPIPTLMCCATKDFFNCDDGWRSYRYAARIFSRLHYSNRISIVEKDAEHAYSEEARVATIRWALLWFTGRNEEIVEHDQPLLTEEEMRSLKDVKSVMSLPGAKSSRDLNIELAQSLKPERQKKWDGITAEAAAKLVRDRAIVRAETPEAKVVAEEGDDVVFETDSNVYLTTRVNFKSDEKFDEMTIRISDVGRTSEPTNAAFAAENCGKIAAVELRGYGDTQAVGSSYYIHAHFGTDGLDNCLAYVLGKTYVGMRVDDLLAVANYYREKTGAKIKLEAEGYAGTVALVAATASPDAFESVKLIGELPTWEAQLAKPYGPIPLTNTIHGVLNDFDVDDLIGYLKKLGKIVE
ncbi:MAG: acetylxylan esterase [Thermoguttaceae bacterium]|nr:acetylxylan esterase [Thermoguttaceae bacterium]